MLQRELNRPFISMQCMQQSMNVEKCRAILKAPVGVYRIVVPLMHRVIVSSITLLARAQNRFTPHINSVYTCVKEGSGRCLKK